MAKFFEWYFRLSPWYQAALFGLCFGVFMGAIPVLVWGNLADGINFMPFGLIIGLAIYYRERRDYRKQRDESQTEETINDYPEELERVEQRYSKQWLILAPAFMLTGLGVSWIIFGIGWYGALGAPLAIVVALWGLGRFGGPSDPKWKRVRDDWRRQRREL